MRATKKKRKGLARIITEYCAVLMGQPNSDRADEIREVLAFLVMLVTVLIGLIIAILVNLPAGRMP